jgi:ataxin-10
MKFVTVSTALVELIPGRRRCFASNHRLLLFRLNKTMGGGTDAPFSNHPISEQSLNSLFDLSNSTTLQTSLETLIESSKSPSNRSLFAYKKILPTILTILHSPPSLHILSLCFKLLRNLCAGEILNQNMFLENDGVFIVVSCILRSEVVGSDHMLIRRGLQVLANVCLAGKEHQKAVWDEMFPAGFLSLARIGKKEVNDPLCMVIYTCCDGNDQWFGEVCSDGGWSVLVEIVRTASSG